MANYITTDTELTATANAIRSKTGDTSPIEYKSNKGFADAIESIPQGVVEPIKLNASWKNDTPASAYGEIFLTANDNSYDGNYDIYWADGNGALSDYKKIDTVTIDYDNGKSMGSISLMEFNAIPTEATKIVAIKNNSVVASYDIPQYKQFDSTVYGNVDYVFNAFSDAHRQYETAEADITKMLTIGKNDDDVVASCGSGDLTANGTVSECDEWKATRDSARGSKPVYTSNGNHEAKNTSAICYANPTALRKYLDTDWVDETQPYFYKEIEGDIFAFMPNFYGASSWDSSNTLFDSDSIEWLEDLLETYRNQRVFVFAHVPPKWDVNGIKVGGIYSGFAIGNGAYYHDAWGDDKTDRTRFLNILDHYKNVIWLSGHSHIKYEYQKIWEGLNVIQYKGGARFVHLSSLSVPRDIMDGSITDQIYAEAEFTRVEVYENAIRLRSYNLADDKYYGLCEYIIDTTPVTIPSKTKTVVSITATKTKTSYYTDETLSTADITVTATYSDSTTANVSSSAVYNTSNVDLSTEGSYTIGISYTYGEDTVNTSVQVSSVERPSVKTLGSISATKTKTSYSLNETLSTADITVTATYSDTTTADVSSSAVFDTSNVDMTTAGAYTIGVSYTEGGVTKTTTVGITVSSSLNVTVVYDVSISATVSTTSTEIENTITTNTDKTATQVASGQKWVYSNSSTIRDKTLYYRWVSDTGITEGKVGAIGGISNNSHSIHTQFSPYTLTATEWTKLVDENGYDLYPNSSYQYLTMHFRVGSSATVPVTINARLQIGYMDS